MPQVQPYSKVDSHGTLSLGWETMLSYTRPLYVCSFFFLQNKMIVFKICGGFSTTTKNEWSKQWSIRNNLYISSRISGAVNIYNLSGQGF